MGFTKETARAAGSRGRARRAENKIAAEAAVAVAEPPTASGAELGEVLPAQSDVLAGLMALAQGLEDKKKQESAVGQLAGLLDKIDFRAYPDLAKSPAIQALVERVGEAQETVSAADREPGSEIGKDMTNTKVPWTWKHVMENRRQDPMLEYIEWEPRFSDVLIWNGLKVRVNDGEVVRTPRIFKEIHDETRRGMKAYQEHSEWLMRKRSALSDPTLLGKPDDLQGMKARGYIQQGEFNPAGGMNMLPPDRGTYEMAARLAGETLEGGEAAEGEPAEAAA